MDNLVAYFQGAFLINLPHRVDRRVAAEKTFASVGWGLAPDQVYLFEAKEFKDRAGFPSPGARGCFDSHLECLKRAMDKGYRHALMIEDDISLTTSIPRLTRSLVEQLESESWDFFYLGHEMTGDFPRATSDTREVKLREPVTEILTTHCYAVNGRAIPRIISHLEQLAVGPEGDDERGPMPIDGAYNIFRRKNLDVRTLLADPKLAWQRPSRSDITPRFFDKIDGLSSVLDKLRYIKHRAIHRKA